MSLTTSSLPCLAAQCNAVWNRNSESKTLVCAPQTDWMARFFFKLPCPDASSWYKFLIITELIFPKKKKMNSWTRFSLIMPSLIEFWMISWCAPCSLCRWDCLGNIRRATFAYSTLHATQQLKSRSDPIYLSRPEKNSINDFGVCFKPEWRPRHCEIQHMWHVLSERVSAISGSQLVVQSDYLHVENKLQEYSSLPHLYQINSYNGRRHYGSINIGPDFDEPHVNASACGCNIPAAHSLSIGLRMLWFAHDNIGHLQIQLS